MKNQNILIVILVAVIFAGGGFFAGTKYQQSKILSQRAQFAGQFGNRAGGIGAAKNGVARGGQILGTILSMDTKSITVQMNDGSSKIVLISGTTSINQASSATANDLKVGQKVSAFGVTNSDGSVTAQNIQINPNIPSGTPSGIPKQN